MRSFGGFGAAVLCGLLVGCGAVGATPASEPEPSGGAGIPVQVPTDVPSIPTDDASAGIELSLPQLPVGGATTESGTDVQCGEVDWNAFDGDASLDLGVAVRVVGYRLDRAFFTASRDDCGSDLPNCLDFTFRADRVRCSIAVRTPRPWPNRSPVLELIVVGRADCAQVGRSTCERFVRAVQDSTPGTISLQAPATSEATPVPTPTA